MAQELEVLVRYRRRLVDAPRAADLYALHVDEQAARQYRKRGAVDVFDLARGADDAEKSGDWGFDLAEGVELGELFAHLGVILGRGDIEQAAGVGIERGLIVQ